MFKKLVLLPRKTKIVLLVIIDIFLSFVAHYMSVFLRYEKLFLLNFEQIKPFLLALINSVICLATLDVIASGNSAVLGFLTKVTFFTSIKAL